MLWGAALPGYDLSHSHNDVIADCTLSQRKAEATKFSVPKYHGPTQAALVNKREHRDESACEISKARLNASFVDAPTPQRENDEGHRCGCSEPLMDSDQLRR